MNEQVFKPLSELRVERKSTPTRTEIHLLSIRVPKDAYLWESAVKHMMKGDELRRGMPEFIKKVEKKIEVHNQQAASFSGPELENAVEDLMRAQRGRGEVRLTDLERSTSEIDADVEAIRGAFSSISKAIEVDQYSVKADCCPTIRTILRQYWF
ncbi:MAG: hypothetical protein ABSA50_06575 [Candidatus Bathyarchaeia archaeon]